MALQIVFAFGGERSTTAYTAAAAVVAVVGAALMVLSGFVLKERIEPPPKDIPFSRNIHTILDNGPLIALLVSLLIIDMVNNLRQVSQMYFAVYVWGDSGFVTYIGVSLVLGMITGMAVSPMLISHFDKKKIFIKIV